MQEKHPNNFCVIYAPACVIIAADELDIISFSIMIFKTGIW